MEKLTPSFLSELFFDIFGQSVFFFLFYDIHSLGQNDIMAPKNAFYFVSVFSEEEPDLNNELEVSVSMKKIHP